MSDANKELFADDAYTTLASDITSGSTTLSVHDAANFPTEGNFRIRIGNELMLVTSVSGTTFTVTRAIESTTASSHEEGSLVVAIVTAGGMEQFLKDNILYYGHKPLYHSLTDENGNVLTASSFTWVNQLAATATDVNGTIHTVHPTAASMSENLLAYSAPATPYTVTFGLRPFIRRSFASGFPHFSIGWRDSSTGRLSLLVGVGITGHNYYYFYSLNNATSFSATKGTGFYPGIMEEDFIRITDDGTDFTWEHSVDGGVNWYEIFTESRTAWTANPNQWVFGGSQDGHTGTTSEHTWFHISVT